MQARKHQTYSFHSRKSFASPVRYAISKSFPSTDATKKRVASPARLVETSHSVSAVAGLSAAPTVQSVSTELGIPSELARESIARPGATSLLENEVAESGEGTTGQQYVPTGQTGAVTPIQYVPTELALVDTTELDYYRTGQPDLYSRDSNKATG